MSELQLLVAHLVKAGLVALLAGMLVRGRLGLCVTFSLYVVAILVGNSLVSLAPARFYTASFWVLKQGVYDALKMAMAIELAWRACASFPGAWRTARVLLLGLLAASTVALVLLVPRSSYRTLWEWQPGVATAAIWLLVATAVIVVFYQLPIGDWQRAIMLGLAPYLLVFVTLLDVLRRHGWTLRAELGLVDSLAYLALVLFWAWAAWRRESTAAALALAGSPA
jgi:hypothetical protein